MNFRPLVVLCVFNWPDCTVKPFAAFTRQGRVVSMSWRLGLLLKVGINTLILLVHCALTLVRHAEYQ